MVLAKVSWIHYDSNKQLAVSSELPPALKLKLFSTSPLPTIYLKLCIMHGAGAGTKC